MELGETIEENNQEINAPKRKKKNPFNKIIEKEERHKRKEKRARIIIRNISYKATEESLKKHFEEFGVIKEVNLLKRPDGKLVGCAFIQYETVNQAAKAIFKANSKEFLGRPVYVDWALGKDVYEKKTDIRNKVNGKEIKIDDSTNDNVKDKKDNVEIKEELKEEIEETNSNEESEGEFSDDEDIPHSDNESDTKLDITQNEPEGRKTKVNSNDIVEGCTLFIKNVPFDATNDDLRKVCRKYGPVYYALINTDPISGHSKGTGFVKFKTKESADLCLSAGEQFVLMDTIMEPFPALSRDEIHNKTESLKRKEPTDSRNLYLAKEGLIMSGSKAADGVSASDMAKRHKLEQIKTQILKNLNRFVSKNRLSIHNIPLNYNNDKLRIMVDKFTGYKTHECRVMRENKPTAEHPDGKSKGFGFVSFKTHQEALSALRKLNNNPTVFGSVNRPIVAFSIEDRSVHNVKQKRLKKSRENNPTYKEKREKQNSKKKDKKMNQKDDKRVVGKEIKKLKEKNKKTIEEDELDDFAGVSAKPGTFVRMRSSKKITAQAKEHEKKVSALKKIEKRKKEKLMLRREKKEKDRPKQGKKKAERDNFSFLVDKYKRLIDSAANSETKKSKRTKWYVE